jgi:DNA-binding NarL/FixJ family response regulator
MDTSIKAVLSRLHRDWPIVERDEAAGLSADLGLQSPTRGVVIVGDVGVGKTTLARQIIEGVGANAYWATGTESTRRIPLAAFARLAGPAAATPLQLLTQARENLLARNFDIVAVDDAHLIDELSITLLHQLIDAGSVKIVATVRSRQPISGDIKSLWKHGRLRWMGLENLTRDRFVDLLERALGERVDGLSSELMWEITGGNALFLRHLLIGALENGALQLSGSTWQLRSKGSVTPELVVLLNNELEKRSTEALHALQLLSVCEPLDLDLLCGIVGNDAIEEAEENGLVRLAPDAGSVDVWFQHPIFGDVVRRQLGRAAARRLRGGLVEILRQQPVMTPAHRIWLAEAATGSACEEDIPLLILAARDALALANATLGERLARAALRRGGGLRAAEVLTWALLCQGRTVEAERIIGGVDTDNLTEHELVRWGLVRIASMQWWLGEAQAADAIARSLRNRLTHPDLLAMLDSVASVLQLYQSELSYALTLSDSVLERTDAPLKAVEWALLAKVLALSLMGRGGDAAAAASRFKGIRSQLDGLLRYPPAFGEITNLTLLGEFDSAAARAAGIMQISSPEQRLAWALARILVASVDHAQGRFDETVARIEETFTVMGADSAALWRFPAWVVLAQAYCVVGRTEDATRICAELRTHFGRHVAVLHPQVRLTEAWLHAAQGDVGAAVHASLDAARLAEAAAQHMIEMLALHDAVRFGDKSSLPKLIRVARDTDGRLAAAICEHAEAVAQGDASAMLAAAKLFERIGALLSAADAAAIAAVAFDKLDDLNHALEASSMANRLARRCGGIRTPALSMSTNPPRLTAREWEIADLAAAGSSNKEIAKQLSVSVRTVEGHLYRASSKLNVTDRQQLAAITSRYSSHRNTEVAQTDSADDPSQPR